jgi:hypothetical protein
MRKAEPDVPYATHLIHVALMVERAGGDEDCVIAALLHDVLEDTDTSEEDVEAAFGPRVASIVCEVSEDKTLRWAERKQRMIDRLASASPEACLVAAADKIHNTETLIAAHGLLGPAVWKRFRGSPEDTFRFYEQAYEVLRGRIPAMMESGYRESLDAARALYKYGGAGDPPLSKPGGGGQHTGAS